MAADAGSLDDLYIVGLYTLQGKGTKENPEKAVKIFKKGAELDNTLCIVSLAESFYNGYGIKKNVEEAIKYYKIGAARGNPHAMKRLGEIYLEKDETSEKGIDLLKKAAELGDVNAISKLALILQTGNNRTIDDYEDSLKFSKMAYLKGDPEGVTYIFNLLDQQKIKIESVNDSIVFLKQAADGGDTNAIFLYSKLLFKVIDENPKLKDEAFIYLKTATDNDVVEAMYIYGLYLRKGFKCKVNIEEARKYLKMAADHGHKKALNALNEMNQRYLNKNGEVDHEFQNSTENAFINASMRFLKMNADRGNVMSMIAYAAFSDQGALDQVNYGESARCYKMAADTGSSEGQFNYGIKLALEQGVTRDCNQASHYFKLAADQGHEKALAYYNEIHQKGKITIEPGNETNNNNYAPNNNDITPRSTNNNNNDDSNLDNIDLDLAMRFLKNSADHVDIRSMIGYGNFCEQRILGPPNHAESARYFKMAADAGSQEGQYRYGVKLALGQGIQRNYSEARRYFRMSLNQGYSAAMNAYGATYERGFGCTVDKEEAFRYYKMAVDKGSVLGVDNIAAMLWDGDYLARNISESARYFKISADAGENIARVNYGFMLKNGYGVLKNYDEACRYFKLAADDHDANAMIEYAKCLEERKNIGRNQEEARRYYQMSTDKDNIYSTMNYQSINFIRYIAPVKYCERNIKRRRVDEEDESVSSFSDSDFEINAMDRTILPRTTQNNFMGGCKFTCSCCLWTFIGLSVLVGLVMAIVLVTS